MIIKDPEEATLANPKGYVNLRPEIVDGLYELGEIIGGEARPKMKEAFETSVAAEVEKTRDRCVGVRVLRSFARFFSDDER